MINSKTSGKECKRDSRIHEKWSELLHKCEKSRKKAKYAAFMECPGSHNKIQGSLKFNPFL